MALKKSVHIFVRVTFDMNLFRPFLQSDICLLIPIIIIFSKLGLF